MEHSHFDVCLYCYFQIVLSLSICKCSNFKYSFCDEFAVQMLCRILFACLSFSGDGCRLLPLSFSCPPPLVTLGHLCSLCLHQVPRRMAVVVPSGLSSKLKMNPWGDTGTPPPALVGSPGRWQLWGPATCLCTHCDMGTSQNPCLLWIASPSLAGVVGSEAELKLEAVTYLFAPWWERNSGMVCPICL